MAHAQAQHRTRSFEIQEFARISGVTVRALQHYDRIGLLKPLRGTAGSKVYSETDLQALVQILALKSVGVPLKRIGMLRAGGPTALLETLGAERRALERQQPVLDRKIFAVRGVEATLGAGDQPDVALLRPIMEALLPAPAEHQGPGAPVDDVSYDWLDLRAEWQELLVDTEAASGSDPGGREAQALAARWEHLMSVSTGGGNCRRELLPHAETLRPATASRTPGARPFDVIGPALARLAG